MTIAPDGWRSGRLEDFLTLQRGFDLTKANAKPGNVPVISSSGVSYFHDTAKLKPPGVVTGRKGSLGSVWFVDVPYWPHDTTLWVKDFKGNDPLFAMIFLKRLGLARFDAATSVPTLNRNTVHGLKVAFPPPFEQRRIAEILSTWDRAIELTEKRIAAGLRRKQALMQQLLTGKVRLPGFEGDPWPCVRLSEVGQFFKGKNIAKGDLVDVGEPCVLYGQLYTTHNVVVRSNETFVTREVAASSQPIQDGDLLFPSSGETSDEIARPSVYRAGGVAYAGGDIIGLRPTSGDPLFLAYALNTHNAFDYRHRIAQGQSVVHIYRSGLEKHPVAFPTIEEQRRIAEVLEYSQAGITILQKRRQALLRQKRGLMQQLLTGKVRVTTEPAEAAE